MKKRYRVSARLILMLGLSSLFGNSYATNESFRCFGTEPFWDLKASTQALVFTIHNETPIKMKGVKLTSAANIKLEHLKIYKTQSTHKNVVLIIQKQQCSDGMSDKDYPYQSIFLIGNDSYLGCCYKEQKK